MASSSSSFECPICFEDYNDNQNLPKMMRCGHVMCLSCLRRMFTTEGIITCPIDRREHRQPPMNEEYYITAYAMIPGGGDTGRRGRRNVERNIKLSERGRNVLTAEQMYECEWEIDNMTSVVARGETDVDSPKFTMKGFPYLLRIQLDCGQSDDPDHIGIFGKICKSNEDDSLIWPFPHVIQLTVHSSSNHPTLHHLFCIDSAWQQHYHFYQQPTSSDNIGHGIATFLSKSNLQHYIRDNKMVVNIKFVPVTERLVKIHNQLLTHTTDNLCLSDSVVWRIANVSYKLHTELNSPPFIINQYKMCMSVYLNGAGEDAKGHISLYMQIMKSTADNTLSWPMPFTVRLELLDIKQQHECGPSTDVSYGTTPQQDQHVFQQPTDYWNLPYGTGKLISLNSVTQINKEKYIDNDNIYFRLSIL